MFLFFHFTFLSVAVQLVKSRHDYACWGAFKYANEYKNAGERYDFENKAKQMTRVNRISKERRLKEDNEEEEKQRSILCMFISSTRAHCRYCFCRQILKWIQGAFCAFRFKRSIFLVFLLLALFHFIRTHTHRFFVFLRTSPLYRHTTHKITTKTLHIHWIDGTIEFNCCSIGTKGGLHSAFCQPVGSQL